MSLPRTPTRLAAIGAALRSSSRSGCGLRVYHCPRGAGWHLTSKAKKAVAA